MAQETVADAEWMVTAAFQLLQEVLTVEVHQLLQVAENDAALSPQVLGQIRTLHLREVVINDVTQGAHIFTLCCHHFIHNVAQFTEREGAGESKRDENSLIHTCKENKKHAFNGKRHTMRKFSLRPYYFEVTLPWHR